MTMGTGRAIGGPFGGSPRAAARRLRNARLFVLVLLVTLASQMSLPAVHAWRVDEARADAAPDLGAGSAIVEDGSEGRLEPSISRAEPRSSAHDPATCVVCRSLHDASRTAPAQAVFALPVSAGEETLATFTPRAPARYTRGDHPPRAPPA